MFENLFDDQDDVQQQAVEESHGALPSYYATRPSHCAHKMDLPPQMRQESNLVGLINQGATCYLNSLFQTLFMTPIFRDTVFRLPLEHGPDSQGSESPVFNLSPKKFQVLRAIQDICAQLQASDIRATSTEQLTKAFGWENNEQM